MLTQTKCDHASDDGRITDDSTQSDHQSLGGCFNQDSALEVGFDEHEKPKLNNRNQINFF